MTHTLLLADDSITVRRVIELTFADEDIRVIAVGDGDRAVAVLDGQERPDIVLADVAMPGRDGYEVARYVRETPRLSMIPVLLLAGAVEPVDAARAAEVGCHGVLVKPFEPQQVIERVRSVLAGVGASPLSAAPSVSRATPEVTLPPDTGRAANVTGDPAVEQYFEALDRAFANLSHAPHPVPSPEAGVSDALAVPDGHLSDQVAEPARTAEPPAVPAAPDGGQPPLVLAFAALLAAEQASGHAAAVPVWPVTPTPSAVVTRDVVDDVVERVLARLSDDTIRDRVRELVLDVAERLVREEIARIRDNVR